MHSKAANASRFLGPDWSARPILLSGWRLQSSFAAAIRKSSRRSSKRRPAVQVPTTGAYHTKHSRRSLEPALQILRPLENLPPLTESQSFRSMPDGVPWCSRAQSHNSMRHLVSIWDDLNLPMVLIEGA